MKKVKIVSLLSVFVMVLCSMVSCFTPDASKLMEKATEVMSQQPYTITMDMKYSTDDETLGSVFDSLTFEDVKINVDGEKLGVKMQLDSHSIYLPSNQNPRIQCDYGGHIPQISDGPWPQFASDLMSCTIVAATQCEGTVMFFEKMFESRIYFADQLISMGANAIVCDPHRVVITGRSELHGQNMSSPDIRAGMAMVIAALCAKGTSVIDHAEIIYRGYENIAEKLRGLGADIEAITEK